MKVQRIDNASRIRYIATFMIAAAWAWAGVEKFASLTEFTHVVEVHGVLPPNLRPLVPLIPILEVITAVAVVVWGVGRFRTCTLLWSLGMLGGVSVYLFLIPEQAKQAVGCGCGLRILPRDYQLTEWTWSANAVLGLLHVACVAGGRRKPVAPDEEQV